MESALSRIGGLYRRAKLSLVDKGLGNVLRKHFLEYKQTLSNKFFVNEMQKDALSFLQDVPVQPWLVPTWTEAFFDPFLA